MITVPPWIFTLAALLSAAAALGVLLARNALTAALSLIVSILGIAFVYGLLGSGFLAVVQVLIYAGAIVTLFVIVVMLLNLPLDERPGDSLTSTRLRIAGLVVTSFILGNALATVFTAQGKVGAPIPVEQVARSLFVRLAVPFELTSLLLLIGVLGVVALARRDKGP
jgi:NADH-quinone oxidoreductase subunit J